MKRIDPRTRTSIEKHLAQDIDSLLCTLSLIESSKQEGMKYLPGQELEQGRSILANLKNDLYRKICVEWRFCQRRHDPELADTVNLVAALMDVVVTMGIGFPPVLISTILVKKGLTEFCGCAAEKPSAPAKQSTAGDADKSHA